MFRVRHLKTGDWVTTPVWQDGIGLSEDKAKAYIFQEEERMYWEGDDHHEITPLTENEILARLPPAVAPRLPGFE